MESRTLNPRFHAAPPPSPSLSSVRISSVFGFSHRIEDHQIRRYLRRVISFKPRGVARYISWEVNELNALRVGRRQLPWASHIRVGANASEEVLDALAREDLVGDLGEDGVDGEEGDAGAGDDGDDDAGGAQHLAERWPLDLPHLVRHPSPQIRRRRLLLPSLHHLLELLSHRCRGGGSCGVPLLYFLLLLLLSSLVGLRLLQGLGSAAVLLGGEAGRAAGARETEG
ncbi:unnamed protein product [Musa acuminata subsp. burmannicoides]